jgi:two-component system sensor histidine kinase and response regulator WspE
MSEDLGDLSMLQLYAVEVKSQGRALSEGLLLLEQSPQDAQCLEQMMRAAHSLKGAARMVDIDAGVRIAHAMEDVFVAAQAGELYIDSAAIDALLAGVDLLDRIAQLEAEHAPRWFAEQAGLIDEREQHLRALLTGEQPAPARPDASMASTPSPTKTLAEPTAAAAIAADPAMLELFRLELESQTAVLNEGLLLLEQQATDPAHLEALMRASHSIKGAARMVSVEPAVALAHAMEDVFVAAQEEDLMLGSEAVDLLLAGTDLLGQIGHTILDDPAAWFAVHTEELQGLVAALGRLAKGEAKVQPRSQEGPSSTPRPSRPHTPAAPPVSGSVRVSTEALNRLMGLAGEVRVESRWLRPFAESLVQIKHRQSELVGLLDRLAESLDAAGADEYARSLLSEAQHKAGTCRHRLSDRLNELEEYDRRTHSLADRLNREVVASRMRPFGDGVQGFQRMVRDLARSLDKKVRLEILGLNTQVDRDILAKIEAPLNHLVRNALDHGIEPPDRRREAGKPEEATITLEAMHSAGMLSILVRDDGRGIDPESLREKVVEKELTNETMAASLSEAELMEFLFLPGFSTRREVTEISGRGVGLDVVHSVVQEMRGLVRASSQPGQGTQFHMQLPLTLSVVRALMVEISGDRYAFPLARIDRTLKLHRDQIETMEGRQYFTLGSQHIGIVAANQVLELPDSPPDEDEVCVVVLGERMDRYALVVDCFLGERNLVVQPLDARLGKIQDVSAASILEDGNPCLITDVDDLLRSVDILIAGGRLNKLGAHPEASHRRAGKRVLVVDDSITVREVERNMLAARGYEVDVAVDGMDGWNAVRTGHYDLVISDIDMPRMNGFEFVEHIKQDPNLKQLPVMIVSYKDREEDRNRGLEVGADYYLTKGSFHDETLLEAVADLIGGADQ